jgi:hypothetical protein
MISEDALIDALAAWAQAITGSGIPVLAGDPITSDLAAPRMVLHVAATRPLPAISDARWIGPVLDITTLSEVRVSVTGVGQAAVDALYRLLTRWRSQYDAGILRGVGIGPIGASEVRRLRPTTATSREAEASVDLVLTVRWTSAPVEPVQIQRVEGEVLYLPDLTGEFAVERVAALGAGGGYLGAGDGVLQVEIP